MRKKKSPAFIYWRSNIYNSSSTTNSGITLEAHIQEQSFKLKIWSHTHTHKCNIPPNQKFKDAICAEWKPRDIYEVLTQLQDIASKTNKPIKEVPKKKKKTFLKWDWRAAEKGVTLKMIAIENAPFRPGASIRAAKQKQKPSGSLTSTLPCILAVSIRFLSFMLQLAWRASLVVGATRGARSEQRRARTRTACGRDRTSSLAPPPPRCEYKATWPRALTCAEGRSADVRVKGRECGAWTLAWQTGTRNDTNAREKWFRRYKTLAKMAHQIHVIFLEFFVWSVLCKYQIVCRVKHTFEFR